MINVVPQIHAGGFDRPESVHLLADGTVAASHRGHGVREVSPNGSVRIVGAPDLAGQPFIPNGLAPIDDGYLVADLGSGGGVWHVAAGHRRPWLSQIDGKPCPPANYVMVEDSGRVWITVSTSRTPRHLAYRRDVADGFIVVVDESGPRVVADGLAYANEVTVIGDVLFVNESLRFRTTAFDIARDGKLTNRRVVASYQPGDFPDGVETDSSGRLWVSCIVSNRIYCVDTPRGEIDLVVDFSNPAWLSEVESTVEGDGLARRHFDTAPDGPVLSISSLALGATGDRYLLCGSLIDDRILRLNVDVERSTPASVRAPAWAP